MSNKKEEAFRFLDALSHDLAGEVLEDDEVLEEELRSSRVDVGQVLQRVREKSLRAIGEERRAALEERRRTNRSPAQAVRSYAGLTRDVLLRMIGERSDGVAVAHRDLTSVPDEDLRSLLEDLDALEEDE